jgi:CBS domain-containing protein
MASVAQILRAKADPVVHTIAPTATVLEALQLMAEHHIGALPVMRGGELVGLVTERHYARRVALAGRSSRDTPVAEIMEPRVWCVGPGTGRDECMALMTERRVRHLVVMDEGRMVGLVSIGDLVKDIIAEQRFLIAQLQHYIAGDRGVAGPGES